LANVSGVHKLEQLNRISVIRCQNASSFVSG
jgi:hypothetical protein